jgi:hypothetical protein
MTEVLDEIIFLEKLLEEVSNMNRIKMKIVRMIKFRLVTLKEEVNKYERKHTAG